MFERIRNALSGGPAYSRPLPASASTRDQDKRNRRIAREAEQAAARRRRHRETVFTNGDAGDGAKFSFEEREKRGLRRRS